MNKGKKINEVQATRKNERDKIRPKRERRRRRCLNRKKEEISTGKEGRKDKIKLNKKEIIKKK